MPAYNEAAFLEAAVRDLLAGLAARSLDAEIVVVENGSTDGTGPLSRRLADELAGVRALSLPEPDYGAALRAGFLAARGDLVVNFDVDYYDLGFVDVTLPLLVVGGPVIVAVSYTHLTLPTTERV